MSEPRTETGRLMAAWMRSTGDPAVLGRIDYIEQIEAEAATPAAEPGLDGSALIAAERRRQIEVERYDASHDAGHADSLARAGAAYALPEASRHYLPEDKRFAFDPPFEWPWDAEWWKPTPQDRVRELVKAGALIAAAIDSLSSVSASEEERR